MKNRPNKARQETIHTMLPGKNELANPTSVTRRRILLATGITAFAAIGGGAALLSQTNPTMAQEVVVYKDPSCGCCGEWVKHMRRNGFNVVVNNVEDMEPIKSRAGIPDAMESCHTAYVGGYSIEGHVPASDIKRMLAENLAVKGLAVPGMPSSAPGMDDPNNEPYTVFAFNSNGVTSVFASY